MEYLDLVPIGEAAADGRKAGISGTDVLSLSGQGERMLLA
jgi:hypothetical protein